jgi:hypothetical protein
MSQYVLLVKEPEFNKRRYEPASIPCNEAIFGLYQGWVLTPEGLGMVMERVESPAQYHTSCQRTRRRRLGCQCDCHFPMAFKCLLGEKKAPVKADMNHNPALTAGA